jgi:hypothetical protein
VILLNQVWSQDDREWSYHFSQGSTVISYDIFPNLLVADSNAAIPGLQRVENLLWHLAPGKMARRCVWQDEKAKAGKALFMSLCVVFMIDGWNVPGDDEAADKVWIRVGHSWRTAWR